MSNCVCVCVCVCVSVCDKIMTHIEGVVLDVIRVILLHNISGKLSSSCLTLTLFVGRQEQQS